MRKVYLDNLPKRGKQIDWKNSIDHKVRFVYDDIEGEIEIVDYDGRYLTLIFDNKKFNIQSGSLKSCQLSVIIGKMNRDYKYEVGTIVNGLEVLEHLKIKSNKFYKLKCIKDGYIHTKSESHLKKNSGCPVCDNKKIVKGINDIATTHPEYVKYFANIEDTYKYSHGSNKKVLMKCPDCGYEKNMIISNLRKKGFGCHKCSDGKSYPEKFVFGLLEQINVEFETEKVFDWVKDKRYDFYIPELDCIIEVHGEQHYKDCNWGSFENTNKNDNLKQQLAINNNIKKYITIDCRESNLEWIRDNILNSELANMFDLSKVNWLKCHEFACGNRVKEACDLWNSGAGSTKEISEIMKLEKPTIIKYLKQGTELGWCDYDPKEATVKNNKENRVRNKKIFSKTCKIILNGNEAIYNSSTECLRKNEFSQRIFDKLIKSKEPFKPNPRYHKHLMHLEGMIIQYIDNENIHI